MVRPTLGPTVLQKRALRLVHHVGYREHTNILFINSGCLKFKDLVKFKTAQTMYKAKNHLLPSNIQNLFKNRECKYNLRNQNSLEKPHVRTNLKSMGITFGGVTLWSSLDAEIRESRTIVLFKKSFKYIILVKYREEEVGGRVHGNTVLFTTVFVTNKIN